jgi:3-keto-5-aminohexanoate cleavage enzyme
MRKVWIEAALNGAWSRALQPGIPDTAEAIIAEGVACAITAPNPPQSPTCARR